jgi:hypothetical protein
MREDLSTRPIQLKALPYYFLHMLYGLDSSTPSGHIGNRGPQRNTLKQMVEEMVWYAQVFEENGLVCPRKMVSLIDEACTSSSTQ